MKIIQFCSVGLMATLSISLSLGFVGKVLADDKFCRGADCNNKDPVEYNCDSDAYVVEEVTQTVYRWQDSWQPQQIVIKHIYSELCQANWTKAYIPDDTYLFLREEDLIDGVQAINGLFKAEGIGYFWAYGNMSNGKVANQSCISLSTGLWFLQERYCTNFN